MSIAIISSPKEAAYWKKALTQQLPDTTISIVGESEAAKKADFLLCWKPKKDQIKAFKRLKVIQSLGAGVDHIFDTNKVPRQVVVTRIIDPQLTHDMWEYTLAATMHYLKKFPVYAKQQRTHQWLQHTYKTIAKTNVSILGLGQIGRYVAAHFAQIGFVVRGWSNTLKEIPGVESFAGQAAFQPLLNQTDVLINILPLTASTKGILNKKNLSQLRQGAYVINVGRGGHLVEDDLLDLLGTNHLSGATLDVFQQEPLPQNHPFWVHPNITVTPHIASLTNVETAISQVVDNYKRMQEGRGLINIVLPKRGY
jgi:glyoxylate/hydroxypyruvate reductase A